MANIFAFIGLVIAALFIMLFGSSAPSSAVGGNEDLSPHDEDNAKLVRFSKQRHERHYDKKTGDIVKEKTGAT